LLEAASESLMLPSPDVASVIDLQPVLDGLQVIAESAGRVWMLGVLAQDLEIVVCAFVHERREVGALQKGDERSLAGDESAFAFGRLLELPALLSLGLLRQFECVRSDLGLLRFPDGPVRVVEVFRRPERAASARS
jgi:hypothetical protein